MAHLHSTTVRPAVLNCSLVLVTFSFSGLPTVFIVGTSLSCNARHIASSRYVHSIQSIIALCPNYAQESPPSTRYADDVIHKYVVCKRTATTLMGMRPKLRNTFLFAAPIAMQLESTILQSLGRPPRILLASLPADTRSRSINNLQWAKQAIRIEYWSPAPESALLYLPRHWY